MILIFDSTGKYFKTAQTNGEASDMTGASKGNISRITKGDGLVSAHGFFFYVYTGNGNETVKSDYIDKIEVALSVFIKTHSVIGFQDRIDFIINSIFNTKTPIPLPPYKYTPSSLSPDLEKEQSIGRKNRG